MFHLVSANLLSNDICYLHFFAFINEVHFGKIRTGQQKELVFSRMELRMLALLFAAFVHQAVAVSQGDVYLVHIIIVYQNNKALQKIVPPGFPCGACNVGWLVLCSPCTVSTLLGVTLIIKAF